MAGQGRAGHGRARGAYRIDREERDLPLQVELAKRVHLPAAPAESADHPRAREHFYPVREGGQADGSRSTLCNSGRCRHGRPASRRKDRECW
jgi:hypothetical protein